MTARNPGGQQGWTLIELVVILAVIGIIAAVAIRTISSSLHNKRVNITSREAGHLAWAITGNPNLISAGARTDFGYVGDTGELPPDLDALMADPGGVCGWDGPYITIDFEQNPNDYREDAWGVLYTYGVAGGALRISSDSAGTTIIDDTTDILSNTVLVELSSADGEPLDDLSGDVSILYGCGYQDMTFDQTTGKFRTDVVPIGQRLVRSIASGDTTYKTVTVSPGSVTEIEMTIFHNFGVLAVPACAAVTGSEDEMVSAVINNSGSPDILVDKLTISWPDGSCWECNRPYLESVVLVLPGADFTAWEWNTNGRSARAASGYQIVLDGILTLSNGDNKLILTFNSSVDGAGQGIDMNAADLTIEFHSINAPDYLVSLEVCGVDCSPIGLTYVGGSVAVSGGGNSVVDFDVTNAGTKDLSLEELILSWTNGPCGDRFLGVVTPFPGTKVWDQSNEGGGARAVSGQTLSLGISLVLPSGAQTMRLSDFNTVETGGGAAIDMSGQDFTAVFRSSCYGDLPVSFSTPGACIPCLLTFASGRAAGGGKATVTVSMTVTGSVNCNITKMIITASTNPAGDQPWVEKIYKGGTDFWNFTVEGGGNRGNTISGSETVLIFGETLSLASGSQTFKMLFKDAETGGANISMVNVVMNMQVTLEDCGSCISPQILSFEVI